MELRTYGTRNVFLAQPGRYHEQLAATAMTPQQAEEFATVVNRAIRDTDFDPIDLAQLASGWTWPSASTSSARSWYSSGRFWSCMNGPTRCPNDSDHQFRP
ncbi:hypothetical protein WDS10_006416 [Pseudomonas aeruginosa]